MNPTAAGEAFLARSIPGSFSGEPFRCDRNILPAPTFTLLASADGKNPVRPLFGENRYGRGRSVYLSFQSNDPEYDDLIKRAIFRAAGREVILAIASWRERTFRSMTYSRKTFGKAPYIRG